MGAVPQKVGGRLDRLGIALSGLCLVHCLLGLVLVAGLGIGGTLLMDPLFHRIGLVLATIVAGVGIGVGAVRHGRRGPLMVAGVGLLFMVGAVVAGHGAAEAMLSAFGVTLVAAGHVFNLRS